MSAAELLGVKRSQEAGAHVVALSGELDLCSSGELEATLGDAGVDCGGRVCVDLTALGFIDSSGRGAVIRAHRRAVASGGAIAVVCVPGPVRRTFEVTGLMTLLTVVPSRDDALRTLAS